ncbi:hypothetical protein MTsPCn5_31390 [Croceitalea sp. MTPC5]|uniref:hypothetical protein n=1 Tax=Croceitalea sp. MTPC5 TaxID=3056565 RepID=UPI002B3AD000|nr:hypothetical protein MTsPCn5_31390 [Croceitalea sp. MTPC5]
MKYFKKVSSILLMLLVSCSNDSADNPSEEQEELNQCDAAINLILGDVSNDTAEISWNTTGNYDSFEIEYGSQEFSLGEGTRLNSNSKDITLVSLDLNSTIDVYVRGLCESVFSDWSSPVSVTTTCNLGFYDGDISLSTQSEVDSFGGLCYNGIDGTLIINSSESEDAITDLSNLKGLTEIKGSLFIEENEKLTNLNGLENLSSAGALIIRRNRGLLSINGLQNLQKLTAEAADFEESAPITGIYILSNLSLSNLTGLENITELTDLVIAENFALEDFEGLSNLTTIHNTLSILFNHSLNNLAGLESIENVKKLTLQFNDNLRNLEGLDGLESVTESMTIQNNKNLESLDGMDSILNLETITIESNPVLKSIEQLNDLNYARVISLKSLPVLNNLNGISLSNIGTFLEIDNCDSLINFEGIRIGNEITAFIQVTFCQNFISFNGLEGLTEIEGFLITDNPNLTTLNGLENLILSRNYIRIDNCFELRDYCALTNLIQDGQLMGTWDVYNAGFGKTLEEMQVGDCD